jgi:very-short-patch-repair endonuclease
MDDAPQDRSITPGPAVELRSARTTSRHRRRGRAEARDDVREVAATQHGLFTTSQAHDAGVDREALRRWRRTGEISHVVGRVWAFASSPPTERRSAMAALLREGDDAALATSSAAALLGLPGFELLPAHVMRFRANRDPRGPAGHTSTRYHPGHVTRIEGLRVTTAARTLFDLAARLHPDRVARLTDRCLSLRLTVYGDLVDMLEELQGRGRPGIRAMRSIIELRSDPGYQPTDSSLEHRFEQVLRHHGLRGFERQVVVGDDAGVIGRVDYTHRQLPVIAEIQSELYHRSLLDRRRDDVRLRRLRSSGWIVVEIAEVDVWHHPQRVVSALHAALRSARAGIDPPPRRPA